MASQILKIVAVNQNDLASVVGSKDAKFTRITLRHRLADEIGEMIEEDTGEALADILDEIVAGRLDRDHAFEYRRALELVATIVGKPGRGAIEFPGRGWQDLGPAWKQWGAPTVAKVWGGGWSRNPDSPWPWKRGSQVDWPVAYVIPRAHVPKVEAELASITIARVVKRGVPAGIARFSDEEHWPITEIARVIAPAARKAGVHRATVYRWMTNPEFSAAMRVVEMEIVTTLPVSGSRVSRNASDNAIRE